MENIPTHIAHRLRHLNRQVGMYAEVEWTPNGFHTEFKSMEGPCYIVYKQTTGLPYAVVRTMSEAFHCAWALYKAYRALEP
jgi:hypothetical protein